MSMDLAGRQVQPDTASGPGLAVACCGPGFRLVARTFKNSRNNKQRVWPSLQLTVVCSTSLSDILNTRLLVALNRSITSDQYCTSLPRALSDVISRHVMFTFLVLNSRPTNSKLMASDDNNNNSGGSRSNAKASAVLETLLMDAADVRKNIKQWSFQTVLQDRLSYVFEQHIIVSTLS